VILSLHTCVKCPHLIKKGWCKGYSATDIEGHEIDVRNLRAASWCLYGAYFAAAEEYAYEEDAWVAIAKVVRRNPVAYNDARKRTKRQILGALQRAIAYRKKALQAQRS